jgi:ketosteroid isomerase-like protein/uncharacterized protein YndB with AHSA1/START domain
MTDERRIDLSIEVVGTPEQVWDAIATGAGVSAWLQPTTIEEHEGGGFSYDLGGGPVEGTVIGWEPPHRFVQESEWSAGAGAATLATEWTVAAQAGGTCTVRMVMSGFGDGDAWDDEIEGMTAGMEAALSSLQSYRQHRAEGATVDEATRPTAAVAAVLAARTAAFGGKDAAALCALYADDAVLFSLAAPLAQPPGADEAALGAWLSGFEGRLRRRGVHVVIEATDGLAVVRALVHVQGSRAGGGRGSWWMRETLALRRGDGGWLITHEHQSVPSAMDESERAQFDLAPV